MRYRAHPLLPPVIVAIRARRRHHIIRIVFIPRPRLAYHDAGQDWESLSSAQLSLVAQKTFWQAYDDVNGDERRLSRAHQKYAVSKTQKWKETMILMMQHKTSVDVGGEQILIVKKSSVVHGRWRTYIGMKGLPALRGWRRSQMIEAGWSFDLEKVEEARRILYAPKNKITKEAREELKKEARKRLDAIMLNRRNNMGK